LVQMNEDKTHTRTRIRARQEKTRRFETRLDKIRRDKTIIQDATRQEKARQKDKTRLGKGQRDEDKDKI
jgi:hypothetical protein